MSDQKEYVGVDLHKRFFIAHFTDEKGRQSQTRRYETNPQQLDVFMHDLHPEASIAVEPVSQWSWFCDTLEREGFDTHLAHPMQVKAIANARIKTDKIDAKVLADLLRCNMLPEAYQSPLHVRQWKELTRHRLTFVCQRTQNKNRIHAILFKNALSYEGVLWTKKGKAWLSEQQISDHHRLLINEHLQAIEELDGHIAQMTTLIERAVENHEGAKLLMTIPGISYIWALTIMAEIGDVGRFKRASKLMSYAGLVPSTYSSGGNTRHGRITKRGSSWLRLAMIEVAHVQGRLRKSHGLRWYYDKMKLKKDSKTAAVATARKLLAVVWTVLSEGRPYEDRPRSGKRETRTN